MDIAVVKIEDFYRALPVGLPALFGDGDSESKAIYALNDNIYDYCNWLSIPLPKDMSIHKVNAVASGNAYILPCEQVIDKRIYKKYCEVAIQSAFSYKCLTGENLVDDEERKLHNDLMEYIDYTCQPFGGVGLLGGISALCGDQPFSGERLALIRQVSERIVLTAREISKIFTLKSKPFDDPFKFYV